MFFKQNEPRLMQSSVKKKITNINKLSDRSERKSAICRTFSDVTDLSNLNVHSIKDIEMPANCYKIMLRFNPISSLEGLKQNSRIEYLDIRNTEVDDLYGAPDMANLKEILVSQTPFSRKHNYKTALLIIYPSLKRIDGELVSQAERNLAASFSEPSTLLVKNGWIPTLRPPTMGEIEQIRQELLKNTREKQAKNRISQKEFIFEEPESIQSLITINNDRISRQEEEINRLKHQIKNML